MIFPISIMLYFAPKKFSVVGTIIAHLCPGCCAVAARVVWVLWGLALTGAAAAVEVLFDLATAVTSVIYICITVVTCLAAGNDSVTALAAFDAISARTALFGSVETVCRTRCRLGRFKF